MRIRNLVIIAAGVSLMAYVSSAGLPLQSQSSPAQLAEKICYFPDGFEDEEEVVQSGKYKICEIPFQFKEPEKYVNCRYRPDNLSYSGQVIGQMWHLETIISSYNSNPELWERQACADLYRWNDEQAYRILIKTAGNYHPRAFAMAYRRPIENMVDSYLETTDGSAMIFELNEFIEPKKAVGVGIIFPADSPSAERFMRVWNEEVDALLRE